MVDIAPAGITAVLPVAVGGWVTTTILRFLERFEMGSSEMVRGLGLGTVPMSTGSTR